MNQKDCSSRSMHDMVRADMFQCKDQGNINMQRQDGYSVPNIHYE